TQSRKVINVSGSRPFSEAIRSATSSASRSQSQASTRSLFAGRRLSASLSFFSTHSLRRSRSLTRFQARIGAEYLLDSHCATAAASTEGRQPSISTRTTAAKLSLSTLSVPLYRAQTSLNFLTRSSGLLTAKRSANRFAAPSRAADSNGSRGSSLRFLVAPRG